MRNNKQTGDSGETLAATYLTERGYTVIERNVHLHRGEIDIIARESGDLVFVEVKTRRGTAFGTPAEAITKSKLRHLAKAAREYIFTKQLQDENIRCDVVAITLLADSEVDIQLFKNAAALGEYG